MSQLPPHPESKQKRSLKLIPVNNSNNIFPLANVLFFGDSVCHSFVPTNDCGGLMAVSVMVKEGDPDINVAIAKIQTNWGGADPETIENQVTDKI